MRKKPNVSVFVGCDTPYEEAKVVLFGAPFDGTVSYRPGTRFASEHIRQETIGYEWYSPYHDVEIQDKKVCDVGDVFMPYGDVKTSLNELYLQTKGILADNKFPFMIGGEHLCTLPVIEAMVEKYPDLHILHFDAHTDLRDDFFGTELSHATVIKKCWDILGKGRIFQFGIRSGGKEEFAWSAEGNTYMERFTVNTVKDIVEQIKGKPVYLTIDLDVMDPAVFPGTGTPEPGGISFVDLLKSARLITDGCNLVGCDCVELAPNYDNTGASTAAAIKIIREILCGLNI